MSSPQTEASPIPPPLLATDDVTIEAARQRLKPASHFPMSLSMPNIRRTSKSIRKHKSKAGPTDTDSEIEPQASTSAANEGGSRPAPAIQLNGEHFPPVEEDDESQDKYEWAVLYENQRGVTLFSIPYYSANSLLPSDPPPFTVPFTSQKRSHQPNVSSLAEYPLPDGTWRWVSRSWMIDMRSDYGEVQYDGFEYNWLFRRARWHAKAGGWVRRRRWVRLMMRPGKKTKRVEENDGVATDVDAPSPTTPVTATTTTTPTPSFIYPAHLANRRYSLPGDTTTPPSILTTALGDDSKSEIDLAELWKGEVAEDWKMVRYFLRFAARDGAKLDLWKRWLGQAESESLSPESSPAPPMDYVVAVLREHWPELIDSFVFPESLAQFFKMLEEANVPITDIQPDVNLVGELSFWSLNSEMNLNLASPSSTPHTSSRQPSLANDGPS